MLAAIIFIIINQLVKTTWQLNKTFHCIYGILILSAAKQKNFLH